MNEYKVSVSCMFDADNPEDAVRQMAAWISDEAYSAGYRVDPPGEDSFFIDADTIDWSNDEHL
jgi:hypothetical protein